MPARLTRRRLLSALPGLAACGCSLIRPRIVDYPAAAVEPTDTLLVLIPGATDTPEDIERHGLIDTLRAHGCDSDIVVAYHLGPAYLLDEVQINLHRDVVAPRGPRSRRDWLAISVGGLVTFDHARLYPDEVDRIVAYAPFLGPSLIIDEIEAEGGLASWTANEPIERVERVWTWLRGYAEDATRPPLDLLWGRDDPGARAIELLAAVLPEARRHEGPGEHGWKTFMSLFAAFLEARPGCPI